MFFKRTQKNDGFRTEKNAVPNPGICTVLACAESDSAQANHFSLLIRGPDGFYSWNEKWQKILWHCPFKEIFENIIMSTKWTDELGTEIGQNNSFSNFDS